MYCIELLLVMLLHAAVATAAIMTKYIYDESDDLKTRATPCPCRRCLFYIKIGYDGALTPVSAPPDNNSTSVQISNVGTVLGLTAVLVLMVIACCVWVYWGQKSASSEITASEQPAMVQPPPLHAVVVNPESESEPETQGEAQSSNEEDMMMQPKGDERERRRRAQVEQVVGNEEGDAKVNAGQGQCSRKSRGDYNNNRKKKMTEKEVEEVSRSELLRRAREGKKPVEVAEEQGNSSWLPKIYTYVYLQSVTNDFDVRNKVGGGGFGVVYWGKLEDGTVVAIKRLNDNPKIDDFKNEVEALGIADHPNLVKLIGYCNEGTNKILVYEYMSNGSLDKWIFSAKSRRSLAWPEMKNIIGGIARGLEYLHAKCGKTILHRDLKPSNVILDENKNAKLCDFGIAKLMSKDQSSTSTARAGTPGYMAPEVSKYNRITKKVDVYSFGIVVLEVLFGKRYQYLENSDVSNTSEVINLPDLIQNLSNDMRKNAEEIEEYGKLAVCCIREKPKKRPAMSGVIAAIHGLEARFNEAKTSRKY